MKLDEYQRRAKRSDQSPRPHKTVRHRSGEPRKHEIIPLLGLVGEVGALLGEYKKMLRDGATHQRFKEDVAEELGDTLWYVANTATKFGLDLNQIAVTNLGKTSDRWVRRKRSRELYDDDCARNQQLPRKFVYRFKHRTIEGVSKLVMIDRLAGGTAGDPLTDNASGDDGYRYHDVLHLTFAACFGWSPVWRKLLRKQKRIVNRKKGNTADVQDGGRAQVIEEAIVAAAYVYASDHNFLHGVGAVDWRLLRHIKEMTKNLEVNNRTAGEWNDLLMRGFELWRLLRKNKGGTLRGDLRTGKIQFIRPRRH